VYSSVRRQHDSSTACSHRDLKSANRAAYSSIVKIPASSRIHLFAVAISLSFVSCGGVGPRKTPVSSRPGEQISVIMNETAGIGGLLFVKLHLKSGEKFPAIIDTGSPNTMLPVRFEPLLGERRGSRRFSTLGSRDQVEHLYAAPELFLGEVRLITGDRVGTSGELGVLGMDCLKNYRVRLDFQTRKLSFLPNNEIPNPTWGKSFRLTSLRYASISHANFFQDNEAALIIDTGCPIDGYLKSAPFEKAAVAYQGRPIPLLKSRDFQGVTPRIPRMLIFSGCTWDNEAYSNLVIGKGFNLLGLKFLGRHIVTLDFPNKRVYLKRRTGSKE